MKKFEGHHSAGMGNVEEMLMGKGRLKLGLPQCIIGDDGDDEQLSIRVPPDLIRLLKTCQPLGTSCSEARCAFHLWLSH